MSGSRRDFLAHSTLGLLSVAVAAHAQDTEAPQSQEPTPGAPPAFGTAPPVGPEVSSATFVEAEKLVQVEMTPADRAEAASNWRMQMAPLYERRTGPRKLVLEPDLPPATQWNPSLPGMKSYPAANVFVRSKDSSVPLPVNDDEIAFATVTRLSRWMRAPPDHVGAADGDLSEPHPTFRSKAALRDHAHARITLSNRLGRRTRRLRRASIVARFTGFRGGRRICSIRRALPRRGERSPIGTASLLGMRQSLNG